MQGLGDAVAVLARVPDQGARRAQQDALGLPELHDVPAHWGREGPQGEGAERACVFTVNLTL